MLSQVGTVQAGLALIPTYSKHPKLTALARTLSRVRSRSFLVTSQVSIAVLQTALVTCSSERKLTALPLTLYRNNCEFFWVVVDDFDSVGLGDD